MWNTCYTNQRCGNSCGCFGNIFSSLFNDTQYICRDCCGNVHVNCGCNSVYNRCQGSQNRCGCQCGQNRYGCQGGCGASSANTNGNGNRFSCVTFCGNSGVNTLGADTAQTQNSGVDCYYARQYGLCGYNRNCCSCGGLNAYQSFTTED